ncbi:hypothetical protein DID88_009441 [Monilinia fructigena]|uniref:Uncharacterized protein n=1 Tax=Monilinia fructigena TaxID=38457 RepID=A0A395IM03_9HELO|nr:hypothetical protein DID88_009441 [Monilinia fructigena]
MKSFSTLTIAAAAFAGVASSQVIFNSTTGTFSCPIANGAYCASSSLEGPIIIRCTNGIGQPGNCNDNLAGFFPFGVNYAPCWETSDTSGDAACSKNCIVQGGSGNFNVPQPITPPTVSTTPVIPPHITPSIPTFTILPSGIVTVTASGTAVGTGGAGGGSGGGSGLGSSGVHNGTTGGSGSGGSATATPIGPSKTATGTGAPEYTGAGNVINVGGLAAVGAVLAWFLRIILV